MSFAQMKVITGGAGGSYGRRERSGGDRVVRGVDGYEATVIVT
jgi:hypothetical protein